MVIMIKTKDLMTINLTVSIYEIKYYNIFSQTIASACIIKSAEWGAETDFGLKQPNGQLATILFWHFFGIN